MLPVPTCRQPDARWCSRRGVTACLLAIFCLPLPNGRVGFPVGIARSPGRVICFAHLCVEAVMFILLMLVLMLAL
jgi:hypothetical protein